MKKLINNFIYNLEFKENKKYNTIVSVKSDLEKFSVYFSKKEIFEIEKIDIFLIKEYFSFLKNSKFSNSSFNRNLSSVKSFYLYLMENNLIQKNPTINIENLELEKNEIIYLEKEEIEKIRESVEINLVGNNFSEFRDRLIFELLYSTGMTVSELLSLGELNFNLGENEIYILKDSERRTIYFSNIAKEYYLKFLEAKKEKFKEKNNGNIIFVNNSNKRLTDRSLRRIIAKYGEKAKINKEISPYVLRHTFCVHMLKNGMPKIYLQKLLGLKSIELLDNYDL